MLGTCWHYEGKNPWDEAIAMPCKGKNTNVCIAEGCFGFSCLEGKR